MSGSGRKILPVVRVWSGGPFGGSGCHPGGPRVVERPTRRSVSGRVAISEGRNAHPEVREWS